MQQLHLVGFTTDLEGLIFSARKGAKSGGYLVVLDDKLRATVEDAIRLRNGQAPLGEDVDDEDHGGGSRGPSGRPRRPRPESTLSPREIQARLRSGSTIGEVAREAGVDEEWVSRFAVPIQAEQAQVVGRARRLVFVKPRLGESALPLGTAVRWNLADKGVLFFDDEYDAAWSAYNLQGASWVVRFEYTSRQKRHVAEWEVDLREGELFGRNRAASELGYIDPARRRRRPPALEPSPRETPGRPVEHARAAAPRGEEPTAAPATAARVEARPLARSARDGHGGGSAGRADGDSRRPPAKGRSPARKAATTAARRVGSSTRPAAATKAGTAAKAGRSTKASKATKAGRASRAGKATKASKATQAGRASKATKAVKASRAGKATKATASRKAAAPRRGRQQKPAGKKRGTGDHVVAKAGAAPTSAPATAPPEEPMRPSHLARPPSPMPAARRATTLPLHASRPMLPRPRPAAQAPRPPSVPPEPEAARPPEPEAARPPAAEPERPPVVPAPPAKATPRPTPQGTAEGVRLLGRPERVNGQGPAATTRRRPPRVEAEEAGADSPERKLARRLASSPAAGARTPSRTRRSPADGAASPSGRPSSSTEAEPVWHGPGSGEPAPTVRIRADLAVGTRRPAEADEPEAPPRRRRERPLRAR